MIQKKYLLWIFIYKTLFEITYYFSVSPEYSYYGLRSSLSFSKFLVSTAVTILVVILMPQNRERPSTVLINILFITTIIPIASYYWLANQSTEYFLYVSISYFTTLIILRSKKRLRIKLIKKELNISIRLANVIFIMSSLLVIVFMWKYGGIDVRAFDFSSVYELRKEAQYSGIWIYLTNWLGKALIPGVIIIYAYKRKYFLLIMSVVLQILLYTSTGHKTFLLSIGLILMYYYLLKKNVSLQSYPKVYSFLLALSIFAKHVLNEGILISLFPVRMLSIPAWLNFIHFDFFKENKKLYFSEGLIGKIFGIEYPYNEPSTFLVSPWNSQANTGFFADAYDNGGLIIMVIFAVIFSLILIYIDSLSIGRNNRYIFTVLFVYPTIILNDSALLTALLTSGLLIILIYMYLFASEEMNAEKT